MAYTDIAEMAADDGLRRRMYACVATLQVDNGAMWVDRWVWLIVAGDDAWQYAWAAAQTAATEPVVTTFADPDPQPARPGWDGSVITDQMIRDRIDQVWDTKGQI